MVERLAYADLVVADMSIPNGNVYYEVGIRHACRDRGCVIIAADWSSQLFDVDQMQPAWRQTKALVASVLQSRRSENGADKTKQRDPGL